MLHFMTVLLHSHQTLWFLVSFDTSIYQSFFNSLPSSSHLYAPIFLPLIMNCSWCILFLLLFLCRTLSYPSLWLPVQGYTLPKPSTSPDLVYQAKFLCFSRLPSPAWTMRKKHCVENLLWDSLLHLRGTALILSNVLYIISDIIL